MEQKEIVTIVITSYGIEHRAVTEDTLESVINKTISLLEHVGYPRQEVYQAIDNEIKTRL